MALLICGNGDLNLIGILLLFSQKISFACRFRMRSADTFRWALKRALVKEDTHNIHKPNFIPNPAAMWAIGGMQKSQAFLMFAHT